MKRVVHVGELGRNACWTPYQTGEGLLLMDKHIFTVVHLTTMCRSVNRKYVDKLQQRIKSLEALNQGKERTVEGSPWRPNKSNVVPPVNESMIPYDTKYVTCE
jgi:hypothetical protein